MKLSDFSFGQYPFLKSIISSQVDNYLSYIFSVYKYFENFYLKTIECFCLLVKGDLREGRFREFLYNIIIFNFYYIFIINQAIFIIIISQIIDNQMLSQSKNKFFEKQNQYQNVSFLRINILVKGDQSKRISLIIKPSIKIQQLKRKIQNQFYQLHNIQLVVGLIEDNNGFTLSNNSAIGQHIKSGQYIFIIPEEVNLNKNMNLSSSIYDNFLTLRYVCNSFCDKMLKIQLPRKIDLSDILPEFLFLGFWSSNSQLVINIAKLLNRLFNLQAIEAYYSDITSNENQKNLLLNCMNFWMKQIQKNLGMTKQLLKQAIQILEKLSNSRQFCKTCQQHSLLKSLINLSKNQKLEVIYQKSILKIINALTKNVLRKQQIVVRPSSNHSQSDYIPSFLKKSELETKKYYNQNNELQPTLNMLISQSAQIKSLGLSLLEKDMKYYIPEIMVRSEYFDKLMEIFTININKFNERSFINILNQTSKHLNKQRSRQQLKKDILLKIHRFLLENTPTVQNSLFNFLGAMCLKAQFLGNIQYAFQLINSPYKPFQEICLKILLVGSEPQNRADFNVYLKNIKQLMRILLDDRKSYEITRSCLKILSNIILNDDCRYEIIQNNGLKLFINKIQNSDVQTQRIAAKSLLNISIVSRQYKLKVVGQLSHLIQNMYKGILDKVVEGYLETILKTKDSSKFY